MFWWCITSFGAYGHSVFDTFVQLTEGRSARDIPKQPPAKKNTHYPNEEVAFLCARQCVTGALVWADKKDVCVFAFGWLLCCFLFVCVSVFGVLLFDFGHCPALGHMSGCIVEKQLRPSVFFRNPHGDRVQKISCACPKKPTFLIEENRSYTFSEFWLEVQQKWRMSSFVLDFVFLLNMWAPLWFSTAILCVHSPCLWTWQKLKYWRWCSYLVFIGFLREFYNVIFNKPGRITVIFQLEISVSCALKMWTHFSNRVVYW